MAMRMIDLNADIGEAEEAAAIAAELSILSAISSANIACGGHRGDSASITRLVRAAKESGVQIGAHPSYVDRDNFGRRPDPRWAHTDPASLKIALTGQIMALKNITRREGAELRYVKPHGALYNDAVNSAQHADLIAQTIYDIDPALAFMGAPNSAMQRAAQKAGLRFITEGFIDRLYTDAGHLQPRAFAGAVIKDHAARMGQARALASGGPVVTASGKPLKINCESLCLHGDSADAVNTARAARREIEALGMTIKAFSRDKAPAAAPKDSPA